MRASLAGSWRRAVTPGTAERELSVEELRLLPPGFRAVGDALVSGGSPVAAAAATGRTLALDGASLGEALSGLRATYDVLGDASPGFEVIEALCVAWSEATLDFLHELSCEDPLTGLASLAHLRTRLAEVYREAERCGEDVARSHALAVVQLPRTRRDSDAPFGRALRMAAVAEAIRTVFPGEETIGRAGPLRAVCLVRRDAGLAAALSLLRELLADLGVGTGARVWIEGLPAAPDLGVRLLSELARD